MAAMGASFLRGPRIQLDQIIFYPGPESHKKTRHPGIDASTELVYDVLLAQAVQDVEIDGQVKCADKESPVRSQSVGIPDGLAIDDQPV